MSNFALSDNVGFHMTFDNLLTVSVIWGRGSYTENYMNPHLKIGEECQSATAEVAVIDENIEFVPLDNFGLYVDDEVCGYLNTDEVAAFIAKVASYKRR